MKTTVISQVRAVMAVLLASSFSGLGQELGPPPRMMGEETSIPTVRLAMETVPPIDTWNRFAVVAAFQGDYLASEGIPVGWNGDASTCTLGVNSLAHKEATIRRVNFVRALAGLSGSVVLDNDENSSTDRSDKCIKAAMMMSAEGNLSHDPSTGWACYSADGDQAAGSSNLSLGAEGPNAINLYMDDHGSGNYFVGHRRWILYPRQVRMGTGSVPSHSGKSAANSLWVFAGFGPRPAEPEIVAWPSAGYFPYQLLPRRSRRWSISIPGANFEAASVVVTRDGQSLPVSLEATLNNSGFADNTLVWTVGDVPTSAPAEDTTYHVTVSGISSAAESAYSYQVIVMDPNRPSLSVRQDASDITVSWPLDATGFSLQQGVPVGASFDWSDAVGAPSQVGGETQFNIPTDSSPGLKIFRLKKN